MSNGFTTYRQINGLHNHSVMVSGMIVPVTNERLVLITQHSASLHLQFTMTPEQARKLSEALLDSAFEVEDKKVEA